MIACPMIMVRTNGEADVFGFFLIGRVWEWQQCICKWQCGRLACMSVCLMKWMVLVPLGMAAAWIQSLLWFKPYSSEMPV
jgi:hypothetical protein